MSVKNKIKKVNNKPKKETPEVEMKVKETPKNKVGRPSDKKPKTKYIGISMQLPEQTLLRMQLAVPKLRVKGIVKTQKGFIDMVILDWLDRNKDLLEIE